MSEYYKGMIEDVINNYDIEENSSLEELIITFKYLCEENQQLKDELEWYKQQCDDLEMQIGCQE